MKRRMSGSFTIEAAIIVPVILFIFGILLHILFYWHDKNILISTAHETAAVGSGRSKMTEPELEYYFFSRMEGKLLLFEQVECFTHIKDDAVVVSWDAKKDAMVATGECRIRRTEPEKHIRDIRKLEKIGEGIVK